MKRARYLLALALLFTITTLSASAYSTVHGYVISAYVSPTDNANHVLTNGSIDEPTKFQIRAIAEPELIASFEKTLYQSNDAIRVTTVHTSTLDEQTQATTSMMPVDLFIDFLSGKVAINTSNAFIVGRHIENSLGVAYTFQVSFEYNDGNTQQTHNLDPMHTVISYRGVCTECAKRSW